jgi:S1/P1 Nuclease
MRIVILVLAVALCPVRAALACGDTGHRTICEIAFQELTDTARQRVKQLIRLDHDFRLFSDACTWPDHPRKRADDHYGNLSRDAAGIGADECPLAGRCALSAIDHDHAAHLLFRAGDRPDAITMRHRPMELSDTGEEAVAELLCFHIQSVAGLIRAKRDQIPGGRRFEVAGLDRHDGQCQHADRAQRSSDP